MRESLRDQRLRGLRAFVLTDAIVTAVASSFTMAMAVFVVEDTTLFWLGAFVGAAAAVMFGAVRPLRAGRVDDAVLMMAIANWTAPVAGAVVATFSWPLCLLGALLPAVLAASYVVGDRLTFFVGGSFVASVAVVCGGVLQDVTGLTARVPDWLQTTVLLGIAPLVGTIMVLIAMQHQQQLRRALDDELAARLRVVAQAEELRRSRQRVVAATDRERRRIERDLHDGAQSRLIGINLQLSAARTALSTDPVRADRLLGQLRDEVGRAHAELRELAHGLYPTELTQHGVVAAIQAAADRSPIPVQLSVRSFARQSPDVEAAVYFCILEAMQNAGRHSGATGIVISLWASGGELHFEVVDDGRGTGPLAASTAAGHGLQNMRDRVGAVGGTLEVRSRGGTTVAGRVPAADRST